MTLGASIKQRRLELELTQQALAKKLGVAQNYVAYLETDQRKPSHKLMEKIAKVLGLAFDQMYFAAYPKLENKFKGETKRNSDILASLKNNQQLRRRHDINDREISLLQSVHPLGKIKDEEDYVKLLLSIRKVYE